MYVCSSDSELFNGKKKGGGGKGGGKFNRPLKCGDHLKKREKSGISRVEVCS